MSCGEPSFVPDHLLALSSGSTPFAIVPGPAKPSDEGRPEPGATDPFSAWAKVREAALAPVEAIAAELYTASAPDLFMLVVAGRQLRQALG
jgi:hypothetical protein